MKTLFALLTVLGLGLLGILISLWDSVHSSSAAVHLATPASDNHELASPAARSFSRSPEAELATDSINSATEPHPTFREIRHEPRDVAISLPLVFQEVDL